MPGEVAVGADEEHRPVGDEASSGAEGVPGGTPVISVFTVAFEQSRRQIALCTVRQDSDDCLALHLVARRETHGTGKGRTPIQLMGKSRHMQAKRRLRRLWLCFHRQLVALINGLFR